MYTVKVRESIADYYFRILKKDMGINNLEDAQARVDYLIKSLPHGSEVYIYDDDRADWIEKHVIPAERHKAE